MARAVHAGGELRCENESLGIFLFRGAGFFILPADFQSACGLWTFELPAVAMPKAIFRKRRFSLRVLDDHDRSERLLSKNELLVNPTPVLDF